MIKKKAVVFLVLAVCMIFFFTFQKPEQSRDLSEAVRIWLGNIGITVEYKSLRSDIHILEYFIVGIALCGCVRKNWMRIVVGWSIGVIDEGIKVLLPGREFSGIDLIKDCFGILCASLIATIVFMVKHNQEVKKGKGE